MAGFRAWLSNLFRDGDRKPPKKQRNSVALARPSLAVDVDLVLRPISLGPSPSASTGPQHSRPSQRPDSVAGPPRPITAIIEDEEPPEYEMSSLTRTMATPQYEMPPTTLLGDLPAPSKNTRPPLTRNFSRRFSNRFSVASTSSVDSNDTKRFSQISASSMDSARSSRSERWNQRMGSLTPLGVV